MADAKQTNGSTVEATGSGLGLQSEHKPGKSGTAVVCKGPRISLFNIS